MSIEYAKDFTKIDRWFNNRTTNIYFSSEITKIIEGIYKQISDQLEYPAITMSGFVLSEALYLDVLINRLNRPGGAYIKMPKEILSRNATINPKNQDEK